MGLLSRLKNWAADEILTESDLEAEFDNIYNNLDPDGIEDASTDASAMQATADPYPADVPSLPTDLRGELQRIRYLLKQINGEAQWYIDPDNSLLSTSTPTYEDIYAKTGPRADVRAHGVTANGVDDETTELQAAIDASNEGDTIMFPGGTILFSSRLIFKPGRTYQGSHFTKTILKQKDNSDIAEALIVTKGWDDNNTTADEPIVMKDIFIDGNKANNTGSADGVRLMNYRCLLDHVFVYQTDGHGIRFTDKNKAGTNITGTAVENRLFRCYAIQCDKAGIYSDGNTGALTDGFIGECVVGNPVEEGIYVNKAAGWIIIGNHVYGSELSGIIAANGDNTSIIGNSVDDFGVSSTPGTYWGIYVTTTTDLWNNTVIGNNIYVKDAYSVSGTTYVGIAGAFGSGVTTGKVSIKSNDIQLSTDEGGTGIDITGSGYGVAHVVGNTVYDYTTPLSKSSASTVVVHNGNNFDEEFQTLSDDATPSVLTGHNFIRTTTTAITDFDDGYEGQVIRIMAEASVKITEGTPIILVGTGDYDMTDTDSLTLIMKADGYWYELSRSVN
jgi:hypothetical protein